jgi:hypothetical protein
MHRSGHNQAAGLLHAMMVPPLQQAFPLCHQR